MREGMAHPGQWLLTVTEKVGMKDWIFCSSYNAPSVSKSTNEISSVQEAWHSSNTYPTVANGQAFRIITRHPYTHTHHREGSYLGNDHLTWRGGGYGFFLNKYSDSQCCWKKYSDFGGGRKDNLIQSFCHIT